MEHLDRLSSLLTQFEVKCQVAKPRVDSHLLIIGSNGVMEKLIFSIEPIDQASTLNNVLVAINVDMGTESNPFKSAMPQRFEVPLSNKSEANRAVQHLCELIIEETSVTRCGADFALNRLCDLLVLHMLRYHIASSGSKVGVFAGLSDPKLKHVVVAIHDDPYRNWRIADFVERAGMSRSQFMAAFNQVVGYSPMSYLKLWKMHTAKKSIVKGERVNVVANKLGYKSAEAFSRAFSTVYGFPPGKVLKNNAEANPLR